MQSDTGREIDMRRWIGRLLESSDLLRMGHSQRTEDLNLGLGWLYYALGRIVRPRRAVVIGSYRGFVPLVFGKALSDNLETGEIIFIDPSLADNFWKDGDTVRKYFHSFGVDNIRHFLMTTQEFVVTEAYHTLGEVGLVFIDGYHSEEQARFDYLAFEKLLAPRGVVLFHDSMVVREDKVYGVDKAYEMGVKYFIDQLKLDAGLQLLDLPFGATGLTLLRKSADDASRPLHEWIEGRP
jgi:predicted O-methyltransferase YrrM